MLMNKVLGLAIIFSIITVFGVSAMEPEGERVAAFLISRDLGERLKTQRKAARRRKLREMREMREMREQDPAIRRELNPEFGPRNDNRG